MAQDSIWSVSALGVIKITSDSGCLGYTSAIIRWPVVELFYVRRSSRRCAFTRGFLVVTPGLTIRDRLRVLQPNDPDSYYQDRELIPGDMVGDNNRPWSLGGVLLLPDPGLASIWRPNWVIASLLFSNGRPRK